MKQRRWPFALGAMAGLAALALGLAAGTDPVNGWLLATRWTARAGFFLLLMTYLASSLARLWPGDPTRALLRDRRWWGLGFAACHTVHLDALVTYSRLSGKSPPLVSLVFGGFGYVLLLAMALTSNARAMRALGGNWKRLHTLGIHWLWLIFTLSYASRIVRPGSEPLGITMTALALAALAIRIAARRRHTSPASFR